MRGFTFPVVKISICFIHRLYSDYLYFASSNKSADDFHEKVTEALQLFENCMLDYSLRACVYNNTLNNAMPVRSPPPRPPAPALWLLGEGILVDQDVSIYAEERFSVQMPFPGPWGGECKTNRRGLKTGSCWALSAGSLLSSQLQCSLLPLRKNEGAVREMTI